jgi:hypothetical protein
LQLDPSLAGVDLGPYFSYARDRIFFTGTTSRLSGELQKLLASLLSGSDSARKQAASEVGDLEPTSRAMLFGAACEAIVREPSSNGLRALAEVAKEDDSLVPILVGALGQMPDSAIPMATPLNFKTIFGNDEHRFDEVFAKSGVRGREPAT